MKIGSIVVNCYQFDKCWPSGSKQFTTSREPARLGGAFRDPRGPGPNLSLNRVSEKRWVKRSRLHPDLYTDDREGEVERLVALRGLSLPMAISI